jgi:DNA primase catalytic subunit
LLPNLKKKQKNKKIKNKKCEGMNKNNVNLLVYSLTPELGIKILV